jgi:hypothetical protein
MAAVTITITTNSDGSITGSSSSSTGVGYTSFSLKAVVDWAKGLCESTFGALTYPGVPS